MDHNENHFIENLIFSEQEYIHNDKGEWVPFFHLSMSASDESSKMRKTITIVALLPRNTTSIMKELETLL